MTLWRRGPAIIPSNHDSHRLQPFEWIICLAWTAFWGVLACIALSEKELTLGGRGGIAHYEGLWAAVVGLVLLGASLLGLGMLLRLSPWRNLLRFVLFLGWLIFSIFYFVFGYP